MKVQEPIPTKTPEDEKQQLTVDAIKQLNDAFFLAGVIKNISHTLMQSRAYQDSLNSPMRHQ